MSKANEIMPKNGLVTIEAWGDRALWTDPLTKAGEKYSYPIPTIGGLRGLIESVYYKPTFIYQIHRIRIMTPIIYHSTGIRTPSHTHNMAKADLFNYAYLANPRYQIEVSLAWNPARPDLKADRNFKKHYALLQRNLARGGRLQPYLGTSECYAYVKQAQFGAGSGAYDQQQTPMTWGFMYHSFTYPDSSAENVLAVNYWQPTMTRGIILNDQAALAPTRRILQTFQPGQFNPLQA